MIGAPRATFRSALGNWTAPVRLSLGALQDLAAVDVVLSDGFLDELAVRMHGLGLRARGSARRAACAKVALHYHRRLVPDHLRHAQGMQIMTGLETSMPCCIWNIYIRN
ncbi:MAG: hypothetical protein QNJ94_00530 [Alphaproteobacteria bacterium]|nr:hypothetical protein [Alphaproteobacteria bacterium]